MNIQIGRLPSLAVSWWGQFTVSPSVTSGNSSLRLEYGFDPDFEIDNDINDEVLRKLIKGNSFARIKKPLDVLKT